VVLTEVKIAKVARRLSAGGMSATAPPFPGSRGWITYTNRINSPR
jgi:hypothetical protein